MARSKKKLIPRRQSPQRRLDRPHGLLFHGRGEPLEKRLLLSGNDLMPVLDAGYGNSPMSFEANQGQVDSRVSFLSRGKGYELFLTSTGAVLSLPPAAGTTGGAAVPSVLSMELVGANPTASITGLNELAAKSNYLRGGSPSITDVPNYAGVAYQDAYPGVDMQYHGSGKQLEYDFTVAAGADPSAIRIRFTGASGMELDAYGNLLLHTAGGDIVEHAPVLYQGDGANRQAVAGGYSIDDDGTVGFTVGPYDAARPLVIDPVLAYSTYLGNDGGLSTLSAGAIGNAIATDGKGNAFVTGAVWSSAFPTPSGGTSGALQPTFTPAGYDAFVTELDPAGQIVFSTYLGGNPDESGVHEVLEDARGNPNPNGPYTETMGYQDASTSGYAIAVDKSGNIYVTGATDYFDAGDWFKVIGFMPLINPFQPQFGGGASDGFVAKLSASGSNLVYSSYLGGGGTDEGVGIAVDAAENAYILGNSLLAGDVIPGDAFTTYGAFVVKVNAAGGLVYHESLGGHIIGTAIAADSKGNVYVTGGSNDTTDGTPLAGALGGTDIIVGYLDPDGGISALVRWGGERDDYANGIALDANDNVYITGTTYSLSFPTTEHAFQKDKPRQDRSLPNAFVAKIASDFSQLLYSTYLGGTKGVSEVYGTFTGEAPHGDNGISIAVDSTGAAYIVGRTASADFPTANAVQAAHTPVPDQPDIATAGVPPVYDGFVTKLDPSGSNVAYSTYLGGSGQDEAVGVAVDMLGNAYVVGTTDSTDFRTTDGAPQENFIRHPGLPDGNSIFGLDGFWYETSAFVVRLAPPLSVEAMPVDAFIGQPFSGRVAKFTAPFFDLPATPITATVNWGDGSSDETTDIRREAGPGSAFDVYDSHQYLKLGAFPVVVTVHDADATTNVNVSQLAGNQSETSIAIDPTNPNRLFVVSNNDSSPTASNPGIGIFAAYSQDGGKSWSPTDLRDHLIADGNDPLIRSGGDPKAVFDQFGNLFLVYINARVNAVVLVISTDGGQSFQPLASFPDAASVDQPSVAVGPGLGGAGGSVWVTFQSTTPNPHINATGAAVSGLGASNVGSFLPLATMPGPAGSTVPVAGNFGGIDIGPDGQVLVTYMDAAGSAGPANIYVNLDPAGLGPGGFNPAVLIPAPTAPAGSHTTTTNVGDQLLIPAQDDSLGIDAKPRLAWDRSPHSSHKGRVYLSYTDSAAVGNQNTRIVVRFSDDNGVTWSPPTEVTPDNGASAFWPSIFVDQANDPSGGDVGVSWYDTRNSTPANSQLFGAISGDGGATFSANVQISLGTSTDDNVVQNPARFRDIDYGDYEGLVFQNGFFYPSWADNSTALGANPDVPNYDVAVARIAVAQVSPSPPRVTVVPLNATEGQMPQGVIAKFTDPDPGLSAADFTVTVDWADGSKPDSVTPTGDANSGYTVLATHTYAEEGGYPVQVTVHDNVHDLSRNATSALDISKLPGNQDEGTIAINPKDAMQLFAASNEENGGLFAAYSTDGGDTWTGRTMADGSDDLPDACCDPIAAFDQYGNLFLTYLDFTKKVIVVALSTDGGQTFSELTSFTDAGGIDKPSLATGPGQGGKDGSVWVAYQNDSPTSEISVVGAAVSGAASALGPNAIGPFGTPQAIVQTGANLAYVAVGAAGQVVAIYETFTDAGSSSIYASLNATGTPGAFGPPSKIADTNVGGKLVIPAQAERKIQAGANVAIDNSGLGHQDRIYVVYTDSDAVGSLVTNIFVRYSDDEAKTWSDPVKVNDDTSTSSKFFPSIAVDQSTGNVGVAWYDTRNDPNNVKTQFFAAVSTKGGNGFSTNIQVSPGSSDATDPGLNGSAILNQYGDYTGLAFSQNVMYPLWADNSAELKDNADPPQFEQAIAKINVANVSDAPLSATALDISNDVGAEGELFTTDVASFTDADPNADLALYTATINWGDQSSLQPGSVRSENGKFIVSGEHAYKEEGSFTITVTINDKGGASAMVTLDTDVEDAKLTAVGPTFRPAESLSFNGVVATFTDDNHNAKPGDYFTPTIGWGDGSATDGKIVLDGTAALTAWNGHSGFLAIGNAASGDRSLIALDALTSTTTALMPLGPEYFGGLAEGPNLEIYALSNNGAGQSFLNLLNVNNQTTKPLAYLGSGFTGGMAFDAGDGKLYAVVNATNSSTLYAIDAKTYTAQPVGNLETHAYAGLAYAGNQTFYATASDADGKSKLYRIHVGAGIDFSTVDITLGAGFTGGLAESVHYLGSPNPFGLLGGLVGLSGRGDGSAFLNAISLDQSVVTPAYEIPNFNNGFAILGTHSYAVEGNQTVTVEIRDVGGSAAIATSTAAVVDEPPVALAPPPAMSAFQGFATGPLTLGSFSVPHGAEAGSNQYTATIDWGDGSNPDTGLAVVSGSTITISSAGHTYTQTGVSQPGAKTGEYHPIVTLSDDTGSSATVVATVHVAPDVSSRVQVVGLGGPLNPATGVITSSGTITNLSAALIPGPLYLIVHGLPAGVTLANASGTMFSGEPFYVANVSQLNAGQTFGTLSLQFSDPGLLPFTYSVTVIDGPPPGVEPAGTIAAGNSPTVGFVANEGQTDAQARFLSQGDGYTLFLTADGAALSLLKPGDSSSQATSAVALGLQFVGANPAAEPVGIDPLSASTNYLIGDDPSHWRSKVASFGAVEYRDIYPGITLDYHSTTSQRIEYDFTVAAGTDPGQIRLAFQAADSMTVDAAGNLVLHTAAGDVVEQAPVIYQEIGHARQAVAGAYEIGADGRVAFRIGAYDHGAPLVIDPVLVYSTYLGGSKLDVGTSVATDAAGNTYITGYTYSPEFPNLAALGPAPDRLGQPSLGGGGPIAFVTKLDPAGAVVYSTFLGGSGIFGIFGFPVTAGDQANGIAVDAAGEVYVTGSTYSLDFPTVNALTSETDFAGFSNGFVSKLSSDGSSLLFSTYLAGTHAGAGIALDPNGNVYIAGNIGGSFPLTAGAVQTQVAGGFVEKLSAAGDRVLYAAAVPGTASETESVTGTVKGIAVDAAGEAYVVGDAYGGGGPVLGAAQAVYGGGASDAFVAKFNAAGSSLIYWTYLGGSHDDHGNAIAVDAAGNAYVAGSTMSSDFPTVSAVQSMSGGGANDTEGDAFAAKLAPDGSSLVYSTYLGGSGADSATGIAVDAAGNAYLTGQTASADFPIAHALQRSYAGGAGSAQGDAFVSRLNASGTALDYSTYLGGTGTDGGNGIAVSPTGDAVVTGVTTSLDLPTLNALQAQAGLLTGEVIRYQPETGTPFFTPAASVGRTNLQIPTAFVARIAAQGPGKLQLANVGFQPTEGVAFTGIVASFTDTDTDAAGDYTTTIDWGDGTVSAGVVASDNAHGFGFVVNSAHTYSEEGAYPVVVTVRDADGSTAAASQTTFGQTAGGPVTYRISVDTSALAGTTGFLDFQFNPGALPGSQSATATIAGFQTIGGTIGSVATSGSASGGLGNTAIILNDDILNELKQGLVFGDSLSFEVRLDGDALSLPGRGLFGSTFSLQFLGADGITPLQTTAADGAALRIAVSPDGSTGLAAADPHVAVAAVNAVTVADAPLQAVLVPIQAVEGLPFAGTVASFTDANPAAVAAEFTASILWGDGTAASEGTIVADGNARFHVTGGHTYTDAASFAIRVVVRDRGGSAVLAAGAAAEQTSILGLQAPRVAYAATLLAGGWTSPQSFATGDFNGDGNSDLAVWHYAADAPDRLLVTLDELLGNGDGSFQDPMTIVSDVSPDSSNVPIAAADFDGDGHLDIASNGVVYLGNGDGTFQTGLPYSDATTLALAVVDFNGDGKPDLAEDRPFGVTFLFGNGDGTFEQGTSYTDSSDISAPSGGGFVSGDFNGDGTIDFIFSPFNTATSPVTDLVPNNGDGTFGDPQPIAYQFIVGAAADINGDGKLDLVGVGGNRVVVLLGNGDGTFRDPVTYAAGEHPQSVLIGDFDGDGKPDLAVKDFGSINDVTNFGAGVSLLKGNGDGTFAAAAMFPTTFSGNGTFAAADFNNDGSLDVAVQTTMSVSILFGQGDGTLVDDSFSPGSNDPIDASVAQIAPADFNGDGRGDVALVGIGTFGPDVLLGTGDGAFQTAGAYPVDTVGAILSGDFNGDGQSDIITGHQILFGRGDGTYLPAVDLQLGGVVAAGQADFNRDGKLDIVTTYLFDPNFHTSVVTVMLGNGDGSFYSAGNYTVSNLSSMAIADMNGDGIPDIVLGVGGSITVLPVNADGSLQPPLVSANPNQNYPLIAIGDFNGDGTPDVAAIDIYYDGVNILLGNGDGSLQDPVNYGSGFRLWDLALGDFNGDGKLDLIAATGSGGAVRILLGNGDGSFAAGVSVSTGLLYDFSLGTGDFNGDGKLDFAASTSDEGGFSVVLGNGDGTFQPGLGYTGDAGFFAADDVNHDGRTDLLAGEGGRVNVYLGQPGGVLLGSRNYLTLTRSVQAADLNGDGRPDLVGLETTGFGYNSFDKIYVRLNDGDGAFPQFAEYDLRTPDEQNQNQGDIIRDLVIGDFNGDGVPDLAADAGLPSGSARAVLLGNGDGTFRTQITPVSTVVLVEKLLARDVNGDGKLDLIALSADFDGTDLLVNLGNGDGSFQDAISTGPLANVNLGGFINGQGAPTGSQGFAVADFTGDGILDAAVGDTDHSISIRPGNGDGTFGAPLTSGAGLSFTAIAAGDLNGDGKIDLLTLNTNDTVSLLLGKGDGTFQKPLTYLSDLLNTDSRYEPLALSDFNADGVPDLIVSGANRVMVMLNHPAAARLQNVADAPLTAAGVNHPATQGVPLFGIVARFTDANPLATLADYNATIAWGDGQTSAGVIEADLDGGFLVAATNTYAQAGTYSATIAITDRDGSAVTVLSAITVGVSPDLALTAVSAPVDATAQVQFSGVVASFTDADPSGSAQDFSATIDWGDGHASPGFVQAVAGGFEVVGANTYANPGNYTTQVTVVDTGGAAASVNGAATVAANGDAPLTPISVTFHATEQTTFSGLVAGFTDAEPNSQAADYSASIDWGDGTRSLGRVSPDASTPGQFDVLATHGYLIAGAYSVTVNPVDREGATAAAHSTAVVEDVPLTADARRVTATEGVAFNGVVASFVDSNPFSTADDFTAAITWSDGQVSVGVVTADRLIPGRFDVAGVHTYAEEGIFPVDVSLADRGGAAASARSVANVTDAPLLAAGATLQAAEGVAFTTVVATFSDRNPAGSADEYTAVIVWGDGRTSPGTVTQNNADGFDVSATHAYAFAGMYATRVSIFDRGGASVVAEGLANVAGATVTGTGQTIRTTEGSPFAGQIASFFSSGAARGPSDFVAAIDWGDGQTSTGIIVANQSTGGFDVFGSSTYAEEGGVFGYSITITIADRSGDVATLNATARVDDAPLTAAAVTVQTIQGEPFTGVLATFTDAGPAAAAGDYIAFIFSGTQVVFGTVVADAQVAGQFDVSGALTFADLGDFPVTVHIYDRGGANAAVSSTVQVVMIPSAGGTSSQANAGVSFNTVVATIIDQNPGDQPSDFRANIDWGDGHHSSGLVTFDPDNPSVFRVLGSSTYAEAGSYAVTVDLVRSDGLPLTAASTVDVSAAPDALLRPLPGRLITTQVDIPVKRVLGSFLDDDLTSTPADFTATIDWGDGSSSDGIVVANPAAAGMFDILGDHTYVTPGVNLVTFAINDVGGASVTANTAAVVSADASLLLLTNVGLSAAEGASATITSALLAATDPPSLAAPTDLVFTLNSVPTHGALLLNGQPLSQGGVFTQDDIDQGRLAYRASDEGPDTFDFSVAVAATERTASGTFAITISDPSVIGTGGFAYTAAEGGAPVSQTIATFTDPGGVEALNNYSASIDWGDGTTATAGVISVDGVTHVFTVSGQHAYVDEGTFAINVTLHHSTASDATVTSMANVGDPAVLGTGGFTYSATEGAAPISQTVATFSDPGGAEALTNYSASIDWGDGTTATAGVISLDGVTHVFTVSGQHTYAEEGSKSIIVIIHDLGAIPATVQSRAEVSDAPLAASGIAVAAIEATEFNGVVATFGDADLAANLSDYTAAIDWGDGSSATAGTIARGADGQFIVSGTHTYASDGIATITATIHDLGGSTATTTSRATIAASSVESISGAGINIDGFELSSLNEIAVATFIASNPAEPASAFSATIRWGDGTTSSGTISGSSRSFTVTGSHIYLDEGLFSVTTTVADASTSTTITARATILEELLAEGTQGTADQRFIDEVYRDVLGRGAEPQGRDFWVAILNRVHSRAAVVEAIEAAVTDEYHRDLVAAEFQHYLHRQAEPEAVQTFSNLLAAGGTAEQLDAILVSSPEYVGAHTAGGNDGFLDRLYADSLHRQVDRGARGFYDDLFVRGASRAQIADIVFASDEYRRNLVDTWYEHYLDRPAEPAAQALFFNQLKAGLSDEQVIAQLLASDEFYAKTT